MPSSRHPLPSSRRPSPSSRPPSVIPAKAGIQRNCSHSASSFPPATASVSPQTEPAPARFNAAAHVSNVLPVVATSSTRMMPAPATSPSDDTPTLSDDVHRRARRRSRCRPAAEPAWCGTVASPRSADCNAWPPGAPAARPGCSPAPAAAGHASVPEPRFRPAAGSPPGNPPASPPTAAQRP